MSQHFFSFWRNNFTKLTSKVSTVSCVETLNHTDLCNCLWRRCGRIDPLPWSYCLFVVRDFKEKSRFRGVSRVQRIRDAVLRPPICLYKRDQQPCVQQCLCGRPEVEIQLLRWLHNKCDIVSVRYKQKSLVTKNIYIFVLRTIWLGLYVRQKDVFCWSVINGLSFHPRHNLITVIAVQR